jgi:hypothetical protein
VGPTLTIVARYYIIKWSVQDLEEMKLCLLAKGPSVARTILELHHPTILKETEKIV